MFISELHPPTHEAGLTRGNHPHLLSKVASVTKVVTVLQFCVVFSPTAKISFNTFKDNFSTGMNFLKRRFSSGDLQGELRDEDFIPPVAPRKGPSPSAPSSPSKTTSAPGIGRGFFSANKPTYNRDRCKTLLVIDDCHTDW